MMREVVTSSYDLSPEKVIVCHSSSAAAVLEQFPRPHSKGAAVQTQPVVR